MVGGEPSVLRVHRGCGADHQGSCAEGEGPCGRNIGPWVHAGDRRRCDRCVLAAIGDSAADRSADRLPRERFSLARPLFGIEATLAAADTALGIPALVRRTPRLLAEFLEFAYAGVYPLIPIALALHLMYSPSPDADRFWTVVLVTDYVCFAMLPFIQTRPPRALETSDPWSTSLRSLNLRILDHASIRMNTVPSGHAAEALAAALLVLAAPPAVVATMFVAAAAVSAGAVLGRYHYSIDIMAGWVTALGVWWWLGA